MREIHENIIKAIDKNEVAYCDNSVQRNLVFILCHQTVIHNENVIGRYNFCFVKRICFEVIFAISSKDIIIRVHSCQI